MAESRSAEVMRLLIFSDSNTPIPANTILATLRAADEHPDLEVCGFVSKHPQRFKRFTPVARARRTTRRALVAAVNHEPLRRRNKRRRIDTSVFTDRGIPVIHPHDGNVNSEDFLERLDRELKPDVGLSYYFGTIFKGPLLERLPQAVNLHPALLPRYRGLRSIEFARYHGESATGLTFHRMAEGIDTGPVLVQKRVAIESDESLLSLTARIAIVAAAAVPELLDLVRSNAPGEPQSGEASYFSVGDSHRLYTVTNPSDIAYHELQRRLDAFGALRMTIDGCALRVTRLRRAREGARLAFRTADGMTVAPDRVDGLPLALTRR